MSDIIGLKVRARQIRNATLEGENTAARVGSLFEDIIDCLDGSSGGDSGDSISIRSFLNTGVKIAEFTKGTSITSIYAPTTGGGGGGGGGSTYDDTELWEALNALDKTLDSTTDLANEEKARLDDLVKGIGDDISGRMKDALDFAAWIQGNFPQGETTFRSGWDAKAQQFLQTVGLWDTDAETTLTMWSNYRQSYNDIMMTVSAVTESEDFTEFLQSAITQGISEGTISINLDTVYANKDEVDDVITWLYSGLKNQSSADKSFNDLVSAARSGDSTGITELRTLIELLHDNKIVATTNLASKVNDAISELYQQATADTARTTIFSTVKLNSDDIAAIVVEATGDSSSSTIAAKFRTWKSGLVTTANKSGSIAALLAANDDNTAATAIAAIIDSNGSTAKISADHIEFTGKTIDATVSGGLNINNGKPGTQGNRNYVITANDTDGFSIESRGGSQDISIFNIDNEGNISHTYNGTETFAFDRDGAGHIANGNISWDANGAITLSSAEYEDEIGNTLRSFCSFDTFGVFKVHLDDVTNQQTISEFSITPNGTLNYMVNGTDMLRITKNGDGYLAGSNKITWSSAGGVNLAGGLSVGGDITADSGTVTTQTVTLSLGSGTTYKVGVIQDGGSYYLTMTPTTSYPYGGIMMNSTGRLGIWDNNSFKAAFDWSDIPASETSITSIERFINSGSYLNGYTIKNGLIVSA